MTPTLLVPALPSFSMSPCQPLLHEIGDGERRDGDRADAFLRTIAGVAGEAVDFDRHAIAAGRADLQIVRRAAVEIERQRGLPSFDSRT